jgi:hypothetical protein
MLGNNLKRIRVGLIAALVGHSAFLVAILFCSTSRHSPLPETIPIVVEIVEAANLGHQLHHPVLGSGSAFPGSNVALPLLQAEGSQTPVVAQLASQTNVSQRPHPLVSNRSGISADHRVRPEPERPRSASGSGQPQELRETWTTGNTGPASGKLDLVEQQGRESPGLTATRRIDWQANPVEDDKLTYSAPGSSAKLTMREAYSAGLGPALSGFGTNRAGPAFSLGFGMNGDENSGAFSPTGALLWGGDATARSQRLDWTFVHLENFEVTAFGYQNEVGRDFRPFGQTKNEFAMAGTSTTKAGGQVRVGPFGFGYAMSDLEYAGPLTNLSAMQQGVTSSTAVQQEASVTLDLPRLLSGTEMSSGLFSKLLPTLWVTGSDKHARNAGLEAVRNDAIVSSFGAPTIWVTGETTPRDIITSSFGGTWKWDMGYASLSYWHYSSGGSESVAAWAGTGRGFNANFGVEYSSFGIDADLSYGQSENVASSWQSAGLLFDSSVTVSYRPDRLPGFWASASAGNYDRNAIAYGGTSSDLYGVPGSGKYWSATAGLDLTSLFWAPAASEAGRRSAVKLLYRYSYSFDSSTESTRNIDNLVAMMIRRNF